MDNIVDEYKLYWETNMFLHNEELDRWGLEEAFSGYDDSSSPDGGPSSKNVVSERNRRKKLNDRLFALRSVVPTISKMDKTSIIKDAIDYIRELQEEERRIQSEIESAGTTNANRDSVSCSFNQQRRYNKAFSLSSNALLISKKKKKRASSSFDQLDSLFTTSPVQDIELRISSMGERAMVVSLSCRKGEAAMVRLCEVFAKLDLKTISTNITSFGGKLLKTVLLEVDEDEKDELKMKIERAIATLEGRPIISSPLTI